MKAKFSYVVPVFHVSQLGDAVAFFEAIGFQREWSWGDPPCYAGLYSESDQVIHLQQQENVPPSAAGLYLQVEDVEARFAACQAVGLKVVSPLMDQAYAMRDFTVEGPDGIRVTFGQEIGDAH